MAHQANLSPATTVYDLPTPMYLPIVRSAHGDYAPESDLADLTRDSVIGAIAGGMWDSVSVVIASDPATGRCWNASQEIAKEALAQAIDIYGNRNIPRSCLEFAEDHLGLMATRAFTLQAA